MAVLCLSGYGKRDTTRTALQELRAYCKPISRKAAVRFDQRSDGSRPNRCHHRCFTIHPDRQQPLLNFLIWLTAFMGKRSLDFSTRKDLPISCGTVLINMTGEVLLCHVTGHDLWDLPKGMQEPGEPAIKTARRELHEETGLEFAEELFIEIGCFDFRPDKRLHLFKVYTLGSLEDIAHLTCISHFLHPVTGMPTPEMDGFRWANHEDVKSLCGPNMQRVLLSIDW